MWKRSAKAARIFERSLATTGVRLVVVRTDRGAVHVRPGDADEVQVRIVATARAASRDVAESRLEAVDWSAEQEGDRLVIVARGGPVQERALLARWRRRECLDLELTITAPPRYSFELSTTAGEIRVDEAGGNVFAATKAGNIRLGVVGGELTAETASGSIEVRRAGARLVARTGAGNVTVEHAANAVDISAGAGSVRARILRQPESNTRVRTVAGPVVVELADDVDVNLVVSSLSGPVKTDFPLAGGGRGRWQGTVNRGGCELAISSVAGAIRIKRLSLA